MNKPSRRAVVRTGVWAVPVVATASAVPAFAGSGQTITITGVAASCKMPGEKRGKSYAVILNVTNAGTVAADLTITEIDVTITKGQQTTTVGFCPATFEDVPPGNSTITVFLTDTITSQNKAATVDVFYTSPVDSGTQTLEFLIDDFHPFGEAECSKDLEPPESCV